MDTAKVLPSLSERCFIFMVHVTGDLMAPLTEGIAPLPAMAGPAVIKKGPADRNPTTKAVSDRL